MEVRKRNNNTDTVKTDEIYDVFDGDVWIAAFVSETEAKDFKAMKEAQMEDENSKIKP